jgi:hypothetical protein
MDLTLNVDRPAIKPSQVLIQSTDKQRLNEVVAEKRTS